MISIKKIQFLGLLFFTTGICAQDANYWSSNYGPGGFMTEGAVIANNKDSGVFFYNPALLAYSKKNSASISGTVYQYESIKIKNAVGSGLDLKSSGGGVIPQMASSIISLKMKKPITIAYAILHLPVVDFQATQRRDGKFDVLENYYSPGTEYFAGQYTIQNTVNKTSAILSAGFKISPKLAIGFSAEGRLHQQLYSINNTSRALVNVGADTLFQPISSASEYYLATYSRAGLLLKGGIAFDISERLHGGLLISSPLINVYRNGSLVSDLQINNIRQDTSLIVSLLATTRQTKLKPKWKMPLSVAMGYTYDYHKGQVYFAVEYFTKIKEYNILTPRNDYFIRPDTANNSATSSLIKLKDARKAVANFALGLSYTFTPLVTGYLSLRTDFSYADSSLYADNSGYTSTTSRWDQYHCQVGANIRRRKVNLRVGLLLTYGATNKYPQPLSYDNPNEGNLLLGDPHLTKASRFSGGLLMAYIHNL